MFAFIDYDHDVRILAGRFCKRANLRRPRWLDRTDLFNLIDDAIDDAVRADIPEDELYSCCETDLVLSGVSRSDGSRQYVLVERTSIYCTAAITGDDIRRVRRNADHFARITGCVAHAAVVGKLPPTAILDTARDLNVQCVAPKDRGLNETDP